MLHCHSFNENKGEKTGERFECFYYKQTSLSNNMFYCLNYPGFYHVLLLNGYIAEQSTLPSLQVNVHVRLS